MFAGAVAAVRRRPWVLAVPLAVAGGLAAWHSVGHGRRRRRATGDAANGRITALLQPLAARLDVQKQAGAKDRLTVHRFHGEDTPAAKALADTVRTPGARVHVRGPIRTRTSWPWNAFEVWLRGP